ncbi:hypothetical protein CKAN_01329900 [Cinnamomum micranthum f. kanehirae]|uniref:Uncharacterized protein n=1 Tax=Cinnamomum micranthum f. kanehirae TaxID=337451 RepID=A0A443P133_9MAGN|nr:hypothetical protein CKAN_01329900 [Cinnamomum micranthum f. kanehirae]
MTYLLRELNQGHDLLRPGITRFSTHFVALESLCGYKANLMQVFTNFRFRVDMKLVDVDMKSVDVDMKPTMGFVYDALDWANLAKEEWSKANMGLILRSCGKLLTIDGITNYIKIYMLQAKSYF